VCTRWKWAENVAVHTACNVAVNKRTECYVCACTSLDLEVLSSVQIIGKDAWYKLYEKMKIRTV